MRIRWGITVLFLSAACQTDEGRGADGETFGSATAPTASGTSGNLTTGISATSGISDSASGATASETGNGPAGSNSGADDSTGSPIFDLGSGMGAPDVPACDESRWNFGAVTPNVLLVVDKSGSMTMTWSDGGVQLQRWQSLRNVVDAIVEGFDDSINLGLQLYPEHAGGFGTCVVQQQPTVPVGPMSGALVQQELSTANIQGSTPLQTGVESAVAHLNAVYDDAPDDTPPQAIILIADGGISCDQSHTETVTAIQDAAAQDPNPILTYVVGIDISAFEDDNMNEYAMAGGVPAPGPGNIFYDTQSGDELSAALEAIAGELQSCTVVLDPAPNPALLPYMDLDIDGVPYDQLKSCDEGDGWVLEGEDVVQFCGSACDALKDVGAVNALYGCPPAG